MEKAQIVKVKFNGAMCRITAAKKANEKVISFNSLEDRIRSSFKLSSADAVFLTYTDVDGDIINLSSDQDIADALLFQQLNPLRVDLQVVRGPAAAADDSGGSCPSLSKSASFTSETSLGSAPGCSAASFASKSSKPDDVSPEVKPKNSIEDLTAMLEKQLRNVLSAESGTGLKGFEPLLKEAPAKIAEVLDIALKGGLSVSFTPILESADAPADSGDVSGNVNTLHVRAVNRKTTEELFEPTVTAAASTVDVPKYSVDAGTSAAIKPVVQGISSSVAATIGAAAAGAAAVPPVAHKGIICDNCDMNPITGLRFKSLVKHDYDLCEACFKKMGARSSEYKCYDTPVFRPVHGHGSPGFGRGPPAFRGPAWAGPGSRSMRWTPPGPPGFGGRSFNGHPGTFPATPAADMKLEARFVADVTIPDLMEMLPGTRFTKIWKLRNTGPLPWPQFTQMVHIGGDALGEKNTVLLQMLEGGVKPQEEVDVSVDMVAPTRPGKYMSHWRLCAPGGPKFGHRVWALIQVVSPDRFPSGHGAAFCAPSMKPANGAINVFPSQDVTTAAASRDLPEKKDARSVKTTAPPEAHSAQVAGVQASLDPIIAAVLAAVPPAPVVEEKLVEGKAIGKEAEVPRVPAESLMEESVKADVSEGFVEVQKEALVEPAPPTNSNLSEPSMATTGVGNFSLVDMAVPKDTGDPGPADPVSMDGYVDAGIAIPENTAPNGQAAKAVDIAAKARDMMFLIEDEESEALDQLEGMGFDDRELNTEALKAAKGNVGDAIDVLMKTAEWDSILQELEEMGFEDKMLNKRMMFKNSGDVKKAVKDIVHFYKNQ